MLEQPDPLSERLQPPRSPGLTPRDRNRRYAKDQCHDIVHGEVWPVDDRVECEHYSEHGRVEQVSWKHESQDSDKLLQDSDLHLLDKMIFAGRVFLQ